jgi:hypothetical protein
MRELCGASRTFGALMGCIVVHRGRWGRAAVRESSADKAPRTQPRLYVLDVLDLYPRNSKYRQTLPPHAIIGGSGWAADDSV